MIEYRGIKLHVDTKLHKKDGKYYLRVKNALDKLSNILESKGHVLLNEYRNEKDKVLIDFKCSHTPHLIAPFSYKGGSGCPECKKIAISEKNSKKSKEEFPLLVKESGHHLLSEYKSNHRKVLIDFCCIHEPQPISPAHYKKNKRCPKCGNESSNYERSKEASESLSLLVRKNGHELLSEYIETHERVLINFDCDHSPQWITPANYKRRGNCPACRESEGERKVRLFLQEKQIPFKREYTFQDLNGLGGEPLRFDFAIFNEDDSLKALVEYDGEFHDQPILGEEQLIYQKTHDRMKDLYCESNGIDLLRIHYKEFDNVEVILSEKITRKVVA